MYDYIIITHIPVFYKVNLYNKLSQKMNILVIFLASETEEKRSSDFTGLDKINFDYEVLFHGFLQERSQITNLKKLRLILKMKRYKKILVSGWDLKEFWYIALTCPKEKNCLALESTILESNGEGVKGAIKRIFLSRIATVFSSGSLHQALLEKLSYKGIVKITHGVGIINKPKFTKVKKIFRKKFLFIGRLTKVKNLKLLIDVFNTLKDYQLTIIGIGEEEEYLKSISNDNIKFTGAIDNINIRPYFLQNDVLILPSVMEPWGLVVEESLYFGLPVIISMNCGSKDLIIDGINGYVVDPYSFDSIKAAISGINESVYKKLLTEIKALPQGSSDIHQVDSYAI